MLDLLLMVESQAATQVLYNKYHFYYRSDKTSLIVLVSSFDPFTTNTKKLLNFTFTTSYHSVVCFSWLLF